MCSQRGEGAWKGRGKPAEYASRTEEKIGHSAVHRLFKTSDYAVCHQGELKEGCPNTSEVKGPRQKEGGGTRFHRKGQNSLSCSRGRQRSARRGAANPRGKPIANPDLTLSGLKMENSTQALHVFKKILTMLRRGAVS